MRFNHNKKRNTPLVYEILIQELTKSIVYKDFERKKVILEILNNRFSKGTEIRQELELCRGLLEETKNLPRLLEETKRSRDKLDEKLLKKEKDGLISEINKRLGKQVFSNFIPQYKKLATVYCAIDPMSPPKERIFLQERLLKMTSENEKDLRPLDDFTFKTYVKKFNEKFSSLNENQKKFLSVFVQTSEESEIDLKLYLNEEIGRLKKKLDLISETKNDEEIKSKIKEVFHILEGYKKEPELIDSMAINVLRIQHLVEEL